MVSLRCTCQTVLSASQASQLPQVLHGQQNSRLAGSLWERACSRWYRCGVLARPRRQHRRQASSHRLCMASRIQGLPESLVGAGLPAMVSLRCTCQTVLSASQASQLPQVMQGQQNSRLAGSLWERACPRWHRRAIPDRPCCLHRRQACSHKLCKASRIHGLQDHCGSGLARDGIAAQYLTDRVASIAGKPAPTDYARPAEFTACRTIVGAGLLAMISLRCTCQTVLSASQASQLPQVMHGQQNSRLAGSLWERACPR